MFLRRTICAVGGVALACAAAYSISVLAQSESLRNLDLRWLHAAAKQDRLPFKAVDTKASVVVSIDLPSQRMTIAARGSSPSGVVESAVKRPRPTKVRTIPMYPVRELPNEDAKTERLPVGCEPAFSPVTTPAFAHIGVRCDS